MVDGKSMLGVFSLPQFDNVELCVDEKEKDMVYKELEEMKLLRLNVLMFNRHQFNGNVN